MKTVLFLCVLAFATLGYADLKVANVQQRLGESYSGYVEDAVVIKFDRDTWQRFRLADLLRGRFGVPEYDAIAQRYNARLVAQRFPRAPLRFYRGREIDLRAWFKLDFASPVDLDAVLTDFLAQTGVLDGQKIGVHSVDAAPNDGSYVNQWHLNQANDHDVDAPEAWNVETGSDGVIVAILDTGVRYFHKDLGGANASYNTPTNIDGNVWINTSEKNGVAGLDDDGNGFVDDWVGWDFVTGVSRVWSGEDGSTPDNDPRDFNGHGTHCAGNVAALNNNAYATAAASGGWGSGSLTADGNGIKVMPLRIGYSGRQFIYEVGYVQMDFAAAAFYYAADNGAKIASCSWGSSNSGGIADAIDYFLAGGGLIFKSAGNSNNEATDYMTARSDIIAVAATDQNDVRSSFSSFGTWVDISAPGTDILSLYHNHNDAQNDYVATVSGTSMASPIAASVAALIWSQNAGWNANQVKQQLFDTADDIYGIAGNSAYAGKLGAGRVNAFAAVQGSGPVAPVAAFVASTTSGCAPLNAAFTDQSTGDITSWSWSFGDGGTSTAQNPAHNYAAAGLYTVSLTVTGPGGSDAETKTNYISVTTVPVAAFMGAPVSGIAPLNVNFADQSTGNPSGWSWNFGDGGTSTAQNPSHTYNAAGTYTVTLTATNTCGSDGETKTNYITVTSSCNPPVAQFSGAPTNGTFPLAVNFTDLSTNTPTGWSWNFGDGGTSTAQNPSHTYNAAGTYTVTLTATNACGSDGETKTNYITVTAPCTPPVAQFNGAPINGNSPLAVIFFDLSINAPTSWAWNFGDGGTSTAQNPSHTYTVAGTYTVTLTATNACGSDGETKTNYITVTAPPQNQTHVAAVQVTKEIFLRWSRGKARVQVVDQNNVAVASATVTGTWSGAFSGAGTITTGADGWGETTTSYVKSTGDYTFCVTNITKSGYTYNPAANVVTCGSSTGVAATTMTNLSPDEVKQLEMETGEKLAYASPNPFNPSTQISFLLPEAGKVRLDIYNVLGKRIATLVDETKPAGFHTSKWDSRDDFGQAVSSGTYFYILTINDNMTLKGKLLYIK